MRIVMIGLIVFALLAAGGVVFFVKSYLDTQTEKIEAESKIVEAEPEPQIVVLVAASKLPAGTIISSGSLQWQVWPPDGVEDEFVASPEENNELEKPFLGSVVRRGIPTGVPITQEMVFKSEKPGFLAGALDAGTRAVAISVSAESGASGFILPGDRVDVILTHDARRDAPRGESDTPVIGGSFIRFTSETVIKDARVIAIDQKVEDFEDKAEVVKTVTLQVTPKQAEIIAVASSMGKLSLTLRSIVQDAKEEGEESEPAYTTDLEISPTLSTAFGAGADGDEKAEKDEPAQPVETHPVSQAPTVKVYRGIDPTVEELSGR